MGGHDTVTTRKRPADRISGVHETVATLKGTAVHEDICVWFLPT
jgi:hypothetical protein